MKYDEKNREELIQTLLDMEKKFEDLNNSYEKTISRLEQTNIIFQEKEEVYRTLFDTSNDAVFIMQRELFIDCNNQALTLFKCTTEDLIGKTPLQFSPEFQADGQLSSVSAREKVKLAMEGTPQIFEWIHKKADGELFEAKVSLFRISIKNNPYLQAIVRDVSYLIKSEEKYKMLIDFASDAFFQGDKDGKFILINNKAVELCGYSKEELLKMSMKDLFPMETLEKSPLRFDLLLEGKSIKKERVLLKKNGERLPVEMYSKQMPDGTFQSFFRDISDRRLIEQTLIESEERYRNMLHMLRLITDNAKDFLWAKDLDNKYIFANKTICDRLLMAKDTQEPIGKTDLFFAQRERELHPDDPEWHTFGEICANTDVIVHEEKKTKQFDEYGNVQGKFLFLDVNKSPVWDNNGNMIGVVGTGRDVTKEKEFEKNEEKFVEALIESENRYRAVVSNTPIISFVLDNRGIFTLSDGKGLIKLGLMPGQIVGLSVYDVYKDYPGIIESVDKCLSGQSIRNELSIEGNVFDVFYSPVFYNDGSVAKVIGVATDITERIKIETLLHEKNIAFENQNKELIIAIEKAEESDRLSRHF